MSSSEVIFGFPISLGVKTPAKPKIAKRRINPDRLQMVTFLTLIIFFIGSPIQTLLKRNPLKDPSSRKVFYDYLRANAESNSSFASL